jgi:4-hydroxybenzoate polyprenyltransferase
MKYRLFGASINLLRESLIWVIEHLCYEIQLNWLFIRRDITIAIVPGLIFSLTALKNHPTTFGNSLEHLVVSIIYFWLCLTSFCMSNQLTNVKEDKLNKPDRPLVIGFVSYRGTELRWYLVMILFPLLAWKLGVLEWALLWQVNLIIYEFFGYSKHWVAKNFLAGLNTISQIAAAWQMIAPITPVVWKWILVLGIVLILLFHVQDLRDIEGDRAINRYTFPIVFGELPTRIILSLGFGVLPLGIHLFLISPAFDIQNLASSAFTLTWKTLNPQTSTAILWDFVQAILSWRISFRVLRYKTPKADHNTYMLFTYWYCLILTSSIFLLRK